MPSRSIGAVFYSGIKIFYQQIIEHETLRIELRLMQSQ
jgi:hypothetical protein